MGNNDTKDWSELFDGALFEANRVNLKQRMKHATEVIQSRIQELLKDENAENISERIALRNALTTLADLQKIVNTRKASRSVGRVSGQAVSG
jgi:hypothetical protein